VRFSVSPRVFLNPNPVKFIIDFTGNWAIWLLLVSISLLLLRKLIAKGIRPVQVSRTIRLYAFFYATLHVFTYFLIYSGYDFIAAFAAFHTGHRGALLTEWDAIFPDLVDDFRQRPFLGIGLFAWALLLIGPVTSPGLLQHALGVKKWPYLYGFIYAAAIAAVIHVSCFRLESVPARGGRCTELYGAASTPTYCTVEPYRAIEKGRSPDPAARGNTTVEFLSALISTNVCR
jgi:DMSO/TMAO reductase YedYZ heme-binding membrane subunit